MINRKFASVATGLAIVASMTVAIPAFAQTTPTSNQGYSSWSNGRGPGVGGKGMMKPGVIGTVSTISGSTITVTSRVPRTKNTSTTTIAPITYTVDATN